MNSSLAWKIALPASLLAVLGVARLLSPVFTYNRWDNFELLTPILYESHDQWAEHHVPYVNPHQHMGEPLLANGQAGVFYPPYPFSAWLADRLGPRGGTLPLLIYVLHLLWAGIGWAVLFRDL